MLFFYTIHAQAAQVSLVWDPGPSPNVAGYRIYYGQTPGNYSASKDVGNQTSYTLTGLLDGVPYYFAVKAYDTSNPPIESSFSNEVCQPCASSTAPTANFSASPISGAVPLLVTFTDASTGNITARSWNFGDGTTSTTKTVVKTYSNAGIYTVSLTVSGPGGSNTATKTNYISATAAPPVANFSASPTTGTAPLAVTFTNTSTGTVTGWSWNFGDSSTSIAQNPAHTYANPGTYTVSLTVSGSASNTKTQTITVNSSGSGGGDVALLGTQTMGQMTDAISQGTAVAFQTKATATGFMTSLSVYVNGGSTGTPLIAGLYSNLQSNNQNHPGSLLAQGTLSNPVASTWNKVPLPATKVNTGSIYWIAILSPNGVLQFSDNVGGALQYNETTNSLIKLTNLPSTWTTGSLSYHGPLSAYGSGFLSSTCPCSIWPATATPTVAAASDTVAVELGVKFQADVNGFITGIRFYKGTTNTGTHIGSLWDSSGNLLTQATFTGETSSGWQQVSFAAPVAITANTVYVASYHAPNGYYAFDYKYFANSGVDNGPVHLLSDAAGGGNGVYAYSASTTFPFFTFNATNYWVDVVFAN